MLLRKKLCIVFLYKYTSDHFMHEKFKGRKFHSCIAWKHNVWKLSHLQYMQCSTQAISSTNISYYNLGVFHKAVTTLKFFSLKTFHAYAISMIKPLGIQLIMLNLYIQYTSFLCIIIYHVHLQICSKTFQIYSNTTQMCNQLITCSIDG